MNLVGPTDPGVPIVRPGRRHGPMPERDRDADASLAMRPWSLSRPPGWPRAGSRSGAHGSSDLERFGAVRRQMQRRSDALGAGTAAAVEAWHDTMGRTPTPDALDDAVRIHAMAILDRLARDLLDLTLHDEQWLGVWGLLHGRLVQMRTGEGKTVTAGIAAAILAATGMPVHVITVNDYLVERDAERMRPLHAALGLGTGRVLGTQPDDERRRQYAAEITYVGAKQVVFDYLRDRRAARLHPCPLSERLMPLLDTTAEPPMMRGLCCAIVDEADSVLLDDALTPCVLGEAECAVTTETAVALGMARTLRRDDDFVLAGRNAARGADPVSPVRLTERGEECLHELARKLDGPWRAARYRRERVRQALMALHHFQDNHHYLVRDDKVLLIDESTGRVAPDRRLQHGLHAMLELKERVPLTSESATVAAISVQTFFQRYHSVVGMSGTLTGVGRELHRVYGLDVLVVPEHRPGKRETLATRLLPTRERQLDVLVELARERQRRGQPVLVGTRTVAFSKRVSEALSRGGVDHDVLSADQDAAEAAVIARAGEPGAVTVATNMAGRGTDIPLRGTARARGGLHVINLELNESRRIDRQLFGRAARQGDPGVARYLLSLEDELLVGNLPAALIRAAARYIDGDGRARAGWLADALPRLAQARVEERRRRARLRLHAGRRELERHLAVGGHHV